jgi:ubiquitin C-terminal hydrolase
MLNKIKTSRHHPYNKLRRHRTERTFTYTRPHLTPVKSADPSLPDEANKENREPAGEAVDIHKIWQNLLRYMEADTTGTSLGNQKTVSVHAELSEHCQQLSSLPAIMKSLVSISDIDRQTSEQKEMLPQDMGFPNARGNNVCWMNATLQTLLGMEPFMEQLESSYRKDGRNSQCTVLKSFCKVVKSRRLGRRLQLHFALKLFKRSLIKLDVTFMSNMQQDATEFLLLLLHSFRDHFNSSNSGLGLEDHKIQENCTLQELQLDNLSPDSSHVQRFAGGDRLLGGAVCNPVCDNVEFCLRETYCCTDCPEYTTIHQDHLALLMNIPPTSQAPPSLQDALNHYMQSDVRERKCDSCSGQHSKVVTAFTKLPRFMFLQVNRYTVEKGIPKKLNTLVGVPISISVKNHVSDDVIMPVLRLPESAKDGEPLQLSLDADYDRELQEAILRSSNVCQEMEETISLGLQQQQLMMDKDCSPHLANAGVSLSEVEAEDESPDYSYRLVCVIMHQGASHNCGHYVADVYNLEKQQWYHYNDDDVSHPTEDVVVGNARQRNGYVFCYMHRPLFDQLTAKNR